MSEVIDTLLQQPGIWRGGEQKPASGASHIATGFPLLDETLPGGGWPVGALTEVLHDQNGIGELRLLIPALIRLSRQGKWIALIAPPFIPYAPALAAHGIDLSRILLVHPKSQADTLWALEQALRGGTCGAVLAWPSQIDARHLRRLQLAAEAGHTWGVLFRPRSELTSHSPAALRISVRQHDQDKTQVDILKSRGGRPRPNLLIDLNPAAAPAASPAISAHAVEHQRRTARAMPVYSTHASRPASKRARHLKHHGRQPQMDLPLPSSAPEPAKQALTAKRAGFLHGRLKWPRRRQP